MFLIAILLSSHFAQLAKVAKYNACFHDFSRMLKELEITPKAQKIGVEFLQSVLPFTSRGFFIRFLLCTFQGDVSDRTLAAQARKNLDHSVSFPPHLRTIVEQKSLEEQEAEELSNLPPSPIQGYIDSFRRGKLGPLFPGCTVPSYADDEGIKTFYAAILTDRGVFEKSSVFHKIFELPQIPNL